MNHDEFLKKYDPWIKEYHEYANYISSLSDPKFDKRLVIADPDRLIESGHLPADIGPFCKAMNYMLESESVDWPNIPEYDFILRDQRIDIIVKDT